jgi:hypothetical protein
MFGMHNLEFDTFLGTSYLLAYIAKAVSILILGRPFIFTFPDTFKNSIFQEILQRKPITQFNLKNIVRIHIAQMTHGIAD